jgi:hypothetical protein
MATADRATLKDEFQCRIPRLFSLPRATMARVEKRTGVHPLAFLFVLLAGCAGVSTGSESLTERGYQKIGVGTWSQSGQWQENPNYELWIKESQDVDRKVHACIVPRKEQYQWKLTVYVDNKERWSRESAMRISGTDCVVSGSLPAGALKYGVSFTYWQ